MPMPWLTRHAIAFVVSMKKISSLLVRSQALFAELVLLVNVCSVQNQVLSDISVFLTGGDHQRRPATLVGLIHVRVTLDQKLDAGKTVHTSRREEHGLLGVVRRVRICAVPQ